MPDRLKDAIVELHYNNLLPFEITLGLIFQSLDNSYIYTNTPSQRDNVFFKTKSLKSNSAVFYNEKIKILLRPKSFIFNFLNSYTGWEEYQKEIRKFLSQITSGGLGKFHFNATSVRYISEYQNVNLDECFKFTFSYGMPDVQSDVFTFRSEFSQEDMSIFLNLQNRIRVKEDADGLEKSVSIVDIDVSKKGFVTTEVEELMKEVSKVHAKQKSVFFSIIKEEFLRTLNPIY